MRTLPLLGLLMLAGAATADAWRWVDEDDQVHYSDSPPPPRA